MIYEFMPTQSYNGYEAPWAGGAYINKCPPFSDEWQDGVINGDGTIGAMSTSSKETISPYFSMPIDNPGDRAIGFTDPNRWLALAEYDEDKTFIKRTASGGPTSLLPNASTVYYRVCFRRQDQSGDSYKIMSALYDGVTPPPFIPWENACMPEGFNIWDPDNQDYVQIYAGFVNSNTRELMLRPVYQEYDGEELVGPWMSSLDPYDEDTTPTEGAFVIDFGGELTSFEITPYMLQTLLESLGIRQHFLDGASLLNSLMDQAQGRVRSEDELLNRSRPLKVIAIGDQLPAGLTIKAISKDVLPGLPGKFIR